MYMPTSLDSLESILSDYVVIIGHVHYRGSPICSLDLILLYVKLSERRKVK